MWDLATLRKLNDAERASGGEHETLVVVTTFDVDDPDEAARRLEALKNEHGSIRVSVWVSRGSAKAREG